MEHRPIIGAAKTGTISRKKAREAARFAKTVKRTHRNSARAGDKVARSSYFRFLVAPATAEPEGLENRRGKPSKKSAKRSARKSIKRSAAKSASKKSLKRRRKP